MFCLYYLVYIVMQNELLERNCRSLLLSVPTEILEFVLSDCVLDISIPNLL
jgi:hypothetical protein